VAIAGVGTTEQGRLPGKSADEIAVDALRLALADSGLQKTDIDCLITCKSFGGKGIDTDIGRLAGINPSYSASLDYGTCNFSLHLAAMAILSGLATTVACVYGTNQSSAGSRFAAPAGTDGELTGPYGFFNIAGPAAMAFNRHRHLYGTTEEQLGSIAVAQRKWAALNPLAILREPLTIDGYLATPYVVRPLRRSDICLISDGGAALIITTFEKATTLATLPVKLLAGGQVTALRQNQLADNLLRPWLATLATEIYPAAGIDRKDVDLVYIQDATSVWVLQMLEAFGFCQPGEGGSFVASGATSPGGRLPVNTNGGQLSEAYMWGWLHLCEAVRQLRGECGPRQVEGARVAQYCSTKGFEKGAVSILAAERS
jgi:acetyl-CoA acetyltransferase